MFNNPALDIAIGLISIYVIYSLLTTTITELVAAILNQRGKILRNGLMRMLDTTHPSKKQTQNITSIADKLSPEFFNLSEIKYLGSSSLSNNYRFPSYIKSSTFAKALLNTIGFTYSDRMSLKDVKKKLNVENDTHRFIANLIDESDNNLEKFKLLAEDWFNNTMDRVSGWYKRKIQVIIFIVGGIISFGLNINTIEISRKLGSNDKTRLEMVEAATNYMTYLDSQSEISDTSQVQDLYQDVVALLNETKTNTSILELNYPFSNTDKDRPGYFNYFFGCLLSALAISLGAPFWFDLLSKLMRLRSSGNNYSPSNIGNLKY